MNLLQEIMRGFGRGIGWKLAGLVVLAFLAVFGKAAYAQGTSTATTTGCPAGNNYCDVSEAYAACMAHGDAYRASVSNTTISGGTTGCTTGSSTGTSFGYWTCRISGIYSCNVQQHHWSTACPVDRPWNEATKTCSAPCDGKGPLPSGTWVSGHVIPPTQGGVCKDSCGYMPASAGAIDVCKTVDGIQYCSVSGFVPNPEMGCANGSGQPYSFGPPPSDSDGDGTSDANDGAPNNPGSTTPPPAPPPGESPPPTPPGEDGSSACGGPGQPECANDGSNKGSGNGNTSGGGGNCATPPKSSGDAILAQIAYQAWSTRCAIENITKDGALKVQGASGSGGGTGGGGTGDGDQGTASFGGCTPQGSPVAFACSGDSVGCVQAEQLAVMRCREQAKDSNGNGTPDWAEADEPDIPGDGDGDYQESVFTAGMGTDALDTENIFGGGACPVFSLTFYGQTVSTADIPAWCDIAAIMRAVILLMGAFFALRLLMGAS